MSCKAGHPNQRARTEAITPGFARSSGISRPGGWDVEDMRQEILQDVADKQTPTKHFIEMYKWLSGWWLTYPSEKYESQLGWFFPIYGKIKNVPNHQPVINECILCIHIHADVYAHMLRSPIPGSLLYPHSFLERAFERPQDEKHCESATGGRVCLHELVHLWWNPRAVEDSTRVGAVYC